MGEGRRGSGGFGILQNVSNVKSCFLGKRRNVSPICRVLNVVKIKERRSLTLCKYNQNIQKLKAVTLTCLL